MSRLLTVALAAALAGACGDGPSLSCVPADLAGTDGGVWCVPPDGADVKVADLRDPRPPLAADGGGR